MAIFKIGKIVDLIPNLHFKYGFSLKIALFYNKIIFDY